MSLPKFDLIRPRTVREATEILADKSRRAKVIAGGTDLLVDIRNPVIPFGHKPPLYRPVGGAWNAVAGERSIPKLLVALWDISELRGITETGGEIRIGSLTTMSALNRSPLIREQLSGLCDAAEIMGSALVRNRGTIGGNICNARPAGDSLIPTLALDGRLLLVSPRGERTISMVEFISAPGKTTLEPDEILTQVIFAKPSPEKARFSAYERLGERESLDIALVSAAAAVEIERATCTVVSCRIAMGAVGPTPLLAPSADAYLTGRRLNRETVAETALLAAGDAKPIDDHRGGAAYRREMVAVLARRSLERCLNKYEQNGEMGI